MTGLFPRRQAFGGSQASVYKPSLAQSLLQPLGNTDRDELPDLLEEAGSGYREGTLEKQLLE